MGIEEYVSMRARQLGHPPSLVRSRCRFRVLVNVRRTIARELRDEPWGLSYPEIGRALNRDHSSVINLLHPKNQKGKP